MASGSERGRTPSKHARGRPRQHKDAWTKVSVVMFERQIVAIDELVAAIRKRTGAALSRADIIRALLDALHDCRLDVTNVASSADIYRLLMNRLSKNRKGKPKTQTPALTG